MSLVSKSKSAVGSQPRPAAAQPIPGAASGKAVV